MYDKLVIINANYVCQLCETLSNKILYLVLSIIKAHNQNDKLVRVKHTLRTDSTG